jgi:hypothetical protein
MGSMIPSASPIAAETLIVGEAGFNAGVAGIQGVRVRIGSREVLEIASCVSGFRRVWIPKQRVRSPLNGLANTPA